MSRNLVVVAVVALVLIAGGWFLMRPKQTVAPAPEVQAPTSTQSAVPSSASAGAVTNEEKNLVTVSASGFLPQSITVKAGETVTWVNADTNNHTVNSNPHPTHTLFPILNTVGLIKAGDKKSLQFTTAGVYQYHDHLNPSSTGTITVQ